MFVAIPLPEPVKRSIEHAQSELRRVLPTTAIRWTRGDQFHVTLRFLGSIEVQQVEALNESVRLACEGFGDLQLRAAGAGVFPGARRPRVVWAGVSDRDERLAVLQHAIETATGRFTNEAPPERFTGHVTLARCRDINRSESDMLATLVASMANRSFGEWTASAVDVIRSETLPGGSRYTVLAAAPLAQPST